MLKILSHVQNIFPKKLVNKNKFPTKVSLKKVETPDGNFIIHEQIPIKKGNKTIFLQTKVIAPETCPPLSANIETRITDKYKNEFGAYYYTIAPNSKNIENGYIQTKINQRRKGFGELMRLASLIEFKENNLKTIDIDAFPEGLPFHLKYKFKPNITKKSDGIRILEEINRKNAIAIYDKKKFKKLFLLISQEKSKTISEENQISLNKFVENYVKQNLHQWRKAKTVTEIPMILTDKMVRQFADFYNKLFKKHGIDYKI